MKEPNLWTLHPVPSGQAEEHPGAGLPTSVQAAHNTPLLCIQCLPVELKSIPGADLNSFPLRRFTASNAFPTSRRATWVG